MTATEQNGQQLSVWACQCGHEPTGHSNVTHHCTQADCGCEQYVPNDQWLRDHDDPSLVLAQQVMHAERDREAQRQRADQYSAALNDARRDLAQARRQITSADTGVRNERERIARATWEWPGGCRAGKAKFLRDIGLPAPQPRAVLRVVVSTEGHYDEDGDVDISDLDIEVPDGYQVVDWEIDEYEMDFE